MEYHASRNIRIKMHIHTYFFVIIVNFLVKLCARNIMLSKSFKCIISFNPWNKLTWKESSTFYRCRNQALQKLRTCQKMPSKYNGRAKMQGHLLPSKTAMLGSFPRVCNAYTEVPKSLLPGNAHKTNYALSTRAQTTNPFCCNPILNIFQMHSSFQISTKIWSA